MHCFGGSFHVLKYLFPLFRMVRIFSPPGAYCFLYFILFFVSWFFVFCFVVPSLEFSVAGQRSVNLAQAFLNHENRDLVSSN
jgi:hypothetical protein